MKILIDARESGTSTGRYIDKLVEHMHNLKPDHQITILTKTPRLEYFNKVSPNFEVIKCDVKEFTINEQVGLLRQIKSLKPDLVHFGMTHQPVFYRGLKVTTVHDLTTIRFNNPDKNLVVFKLKQQVYKAVIKSVAKTSRCIITISQYVKKDLASFTGVDPRKIAVTYEAADKITEPLVAMPRLVGKKFIMYVGRPLPHKNLSRLVEAFALLHKEDSALMLVLAGKADANYKRIGALVTEHRLAASVIFTDFVTDSELRWLYEHCAAYVFPSLSEGFGLPSLEAMVHGAPVVSSNATCLPEINGDAAHYFNPTDVDDIAKAISEVISDKKLATKLVTSGYEQVKKYSWSKTAQQTLDIYELALKP